MDKIDRIFNSQIPVLKLIGYSKQEVINYINKALTIAKEDQDTYIQLLEEQSFEGWNSDEIKGYKTALTSIKEKKSTFNLSNTDNNG